MASIGFDNKQFFFDRQVVIAARYGFHRAQLEDDEAHQAAILAHARHDAIEVGHVGDVDVIVLDKKGNFIRDLKPGDFRILENDKEQEIITFDIHRN